MRKKLAYWSGLIEAVRRGMRKFCENFRDTRQLFENFVLGIVKGIFFGKFYNVQVFCTFDHYSITVEKILKEFFESRKNFASLLAMIQTNSGRKK